MSETLKVYGKTYTDVTGIKASTPEGETRAFTIGTDDYEELNNQPSINNVTLVGNKTAAQLGLAAASDIPTVPVQSVNGQTGAVSLSAADVGAGTYSKPSGGIPKTDLASAVQTSLGKADTALQSHQSLAAYRTSADQDIIDGGKITEPSSASADQVLSYNGTNWDAKTLLFIVTGTISSTSLTLTDARITANSYVVSILSANPASNIGSVLQWTSANGSLTVAGTISGSVSVALLLANIG